MRTINLLHVKWVKPNSIAVPSFAKPVINVSTSQHAIPAFVNSSETEETSSIFSFEVSVNDAIPIKPKCPEIPINKKLIN